MSGQSWINEFYPVEAKDVSKEDAVAHSLKKWRGLTLASLHKHNINEPPIDVSASTCALCVHHLKPMEYIPDESELDDSSHDCSGCPLHKVLGKPCDYGHDSPYSRYTRRDNPAWMISYLEKAAAIDLVPEVGGRFGEIQLIVARSSGKSTMS